MAVCIFVWIEGMVATESPRPVGDCKTECENPAQLYEGTKRCLGICTFG